MKNFAAYSLDGSLHYIRTDWEHHGETIGAGTAVYSELMDTCVWCLPNPGKGSLYRSGHALILVLKSGAAPHLDNINAGSHGRNRSNVWSYPHVVRPRRGRDRRPEQRADAKPVALVADIIKDASARGDVVLAAFAGCDAALLAAEVDSDPRRVDKVIRRSQALTGKQAIWVNSGETFAARTAVLQAASARTGNTGEHT
jgi:hypothetical protein